MSGVRRTWFRRVMTVAAMLAVAVLPLRAAGLCEMPAERRGAGVAMNGEHAEHAEHAEHTEHAEHAAHAGHSTPAAPATHPPHDGSSPDACPDLAGCAVLALAATASERQRETLTVESPVASVAALEDGPATSLDPPPPRR